MSILDKQPNFEFEYLVPSYRQVVCMDCRKGFDSHKYMHLDCPICGGKLVPIQDAD